MCVCVLGVGGLGWWRSLFFPSKKRFKIEQKKKICELSAWQTIHTKSQDLFCFEKIKQKKFKLSSAGFVIGTFKVKIFNPF